MGKYVWGCVCRELLMRLLYVVRKVHADIVHSPTSLCHTWLVRLCSVIYRQLYSVIFLASHFTTPVPTADTKNAQSNNEPNTSYAGIVEKRLSPSAGMSVPKSREGVWAGNGGKVVRSWTRVAMR